MIKETETRIYKCRSCKRTNIRKNGYNVSGSLQYYCKDCHTRKVFNPKKGYREEEKEKIVKSYFERGSMRGVCRIFGVSRMTLISGWRGVKNTLQSFSCGKII